jgi:hypothetical protein
MSSTMYALQLAAPAGVARPCAIVGLANGHVASRMWNDSFATTGTATANGNKRPARHLGSPPV